MNTLIHTTHFPFPTLQLFAGFVTRPILDTDTWEDIKAEFCSHKIFAVPTIRSYRGGAAQDPT